MPENQLPYRHNRSPNDTYRCPECGRVFTASRKPIWKEVRAREAALPSLFHDNVTLPVERVGKAGTLQKIYISAEIASTYRQGPSKPAAGLLGIGERYWQEILAIFLSLSGLILWAVSLWNVNMRNMNDLGLISVLPPMVFVGLGLLSASFCLLLYWQRFGTPVILFHLLLLIFMIYGIAPILEETPRTPITWKLVGIMDKVMQTGTVDPARDAFQNWPGFFILAAFFTRVLGFESPLAYAAWAPVFLNLLYLGPLALIFRAGTRDKRMVWLALWLFYLANWIGQDYLSPQAFNYFLYLVIFAVLLQWFNATPEQPEWFYQRWLRRTAVSKLAVRVNSFFVQKSLPDQPSQSWQRVGLLAIILILFLVIVPSHQLTPFAAIAAVTALVVFNRLTPRGLPIIMIVITAAWISYMTVAFLSGHKDMVASPIGALTENLSANVSNRFRGSPEHLLILQLRLIMSFLLWNLAFLGILRRQLKGQLDITFTLLAVVPFAFIALQSYGGELLMRIYLFSLPFMAFFGAAVFYPARDTGRSGWSAVWAGLLSLFLVVGFFFTRYGNERMDYFTPQEVEAVEYLYSIAEPGDQLIAGTQTLPWRYQGYDSYKYGTVERLVRTNDIDGLILAMQDRDYPQSYLILTRSQKASGLLFIGWQPGVWERFENGVLDSNRFELVYSNQDAKIFVLR